jgi:hypothetical protein
MKEEKVSLYVDGPILHGTVYKSLVKCGKKSCGCAKDRKKVHPAYQWSGNIDGRNTSRSLTKDMFLECKKRTKNYRKLKELLNKEIDKAIKNAPWVKK